MATARVVIEPDSRRGLGFLTAAAVIGVFHAVWSLYWMLGGCWLLDTVGQFAVDMQAGGGPQPIVLMAVVGVVKISAALVPRYVHAGWVRKVSWLGAAIVIIWGGLGMAGGIIGLVLNSPEADRVALWGHAALWDPLFIVWGILLLLGLRASRSWWR